MPLPHGRLVAAAHGTTMDGFSLYLVLELICTEYVIKQVSFLQKRTSWACCLEPKWLRCWKENVRKTLEKHRFSTILDKFVWKTYEKHRFLTIWGGTCTKNPWKTMILEGGARRQPATPGGNRRPPPAQNETTKIKVCEGGGRGPGERRETGGEERSGKVQL